MVFARGGNTEERITEKCCGKIPLKMSIWKSGQDFVLVCYNSDAENLRAWFRWLGYYLRVFS